MAQLMNNVNKALGGDRLGNGNKMDVNLHGYNRSTHNLSHAWRSSMTTGTLVPFLKVLGLPGDTFSIDLESLVKTIPTVGPLYGSYKLQCDLFLCPIRLYNGLLHNNMTKIGLNMDQVKLPKFTLTSTMWQPVNTLYSKDYNELATDSLLNYLGLSGVGGVAWNTVAKTNVTVERKFNAVPLLAYWEIYKNYYANKQEEIGCYIGYKSLNQYSYFQRLTSLNPQGEDLSQYRWDLTSTDSEPAPVSIGMGKHWQKMTGRTLYTQDDEADQMVLTANGFWSLDDTPIGVILYDVTGEQYIKVDLTDLYTNVYTNGFDKVHVNGMNLTDYNNHTIYGFFFSRADNGESQTSIETFDLDDIDHSRITILNNTGLNVEVDVSEMDGPYKFICGADAAGRLNSCHNMYGLALKTYQSDIFQNWLSTEWIDGVGGVNEISAVDTSSGSFTIDALNMAHKVYNMLNRIAVSGGSYEDYIESVYTVLPNRRAETPVYVGGMSAEIVFDEVVSQAATSDQPLGSLAGRGGVVSKKGGSIEIGMLDEAAYIMGIVSITPRVDYSQGNDWDITELDTMADLHVPALDGIGFQDLLQERMAYFGTVWDGLKWVKLAVGKSPAWIDYMTAVNRTHGDFASDKKAMYMTLNRRYEAPLGTVSETEDGIQDVTTYVDPAKYNYAFADASLDAQNFWVQIGMRVIARRVMSAKIMPTL